MTNQTKRENRTAPVHTVTRPSVRRLFEVWAKGRGLSVSAAVEGLMVDALLRELSTTPVGLLTRDLTPEALERIETVMGARSAP